MQFFEHICRAARQKAVLMVFAGCALGIGLPARAATTYFVDSSAGSDSWTGQHELPTDTDGPWRTLRRVAVTPLQPGDTVVLKCGGIWHEPLLIRGAGSTEATVGIRAELDCGEAARPEINLAESVGAWVDEGGEVYSAEAGFQVKQVFVNGQFLDQARYPASAFLSAESGIPALSPGTGSTGLVDSKLLGLAGKDVAGAKAYIRTVHWRIEEVNVASLSMSQLRLSTATSYAVRKAAGYYLTGKRWMLDSGPGWYWNPGEKRLYVRLPDGSSPDGQLLEAARHDYGVRLVNQPHVQLSGIRVRYAGVDGVRVEHSAQTTLSDMEIVASGRDGIALSGGSSGTVQDSVIRESGRDGISLSQSHGVTVLGNRIEDSGTIGGPRNSFAAINATGSDYVRVERNTVSRAGYIGIRFNRNSQVVNNVVRDTCLVLDDCAAIYSWANTDPSPLNSEVVGNVVENVVGNRTGSPDLWTLAAGIYLDDLVNGVLVSGNTVRQAGRGIFLHNAFDNIVQGNTVADSRTYSLALDFDHLKYPLSGLRANTITSNVVVVSGGVPFLYYLNRNGRDPIDLLDQNIYLSNKPEPYFVVQRQGVAGNSVTRYSFFLLRYFLAKENMGSIRTLGTTPALIVNDSGEARDFDCPGLPSNACSNAIDTAGNRISWPVRVAPFSSLAVINK
jgi:parallel beta-helix repeat protein